MRVLAQFKEPTSYLYECVIFRLNKFHFARNIKLKNIRNTICSRFEHFPFAGAAEFNFIFQYMVAMGIPKKFSMIIATV